MIPYGTGYSQVSATPRKYHDQVKWHENMDNAAAKRYKQRVGWRSESPEPCTRALRRVSMSGLGVRLGGGAVPSWTYQAVIIVSRPQCSPRTVALSLLPLPRSQENLRAQTLRALPRTKKEGGVSCMIPKGRVAVPPTANL